MKLDIRILSLLLISLVGLVFAKDQLQNMVTGAPLHSTVDIVATPPVHVCHCVPTEHLLLKFCVKNYNKQFPQAGVPENNDTEGLPENVLQAIKMLANDILFVAQDGIAIVPTLNIHGNLFLPMFKVSDFKLCKEILHNVDVTTTLSAEELYQQWSDALKDMKSAQ
jgi:hypothetical protein